MNENAADVVVVGGGVVGLSCALELLERGREVVVLEAGRVGSGSSHGNCGTITPSHAPPIAAPGMVGQALRWMLRSDAPLYIRPRWDPELWRWLWQVAKRCNREDWLASARARAALLNASRELLERWVQERGLDCEFRASGLVYVFRTLEMLERHAGECEQLATLGIASEVWNAARLIREEPALRGGVAGGIFFPGDACLRPDRLVNALARAVRERGGRILERCEVASIEADPVRVRLVLAEQGTWVAARAVLATGAWSSRWSAALGVRIPVQPGKGYSITYERPAQVPQRPLVLKERSVCVTAWEGGYRLGSTMEFSGMDARLDPVRLRALEDAARDYLRDPLGPMRLEEWYGWRPMSPDDLPLIGPVPGRSSVLLATGHGMLGVSMSAVTALLVASMVCGETPPIDPTPCRVDRFA